MAFSCEAAINSIAHVVPSKKLVSTVFELSGESENEACRISIGTMHLTKGLEFKAVVVMACDDDVLPLESVADEVELGDVYDTERQLLYVACTRARDRLMVSSVFGVFG